MNITSTTLGRMAGLAAVAAGLLFIAVQINHPPMDVASVSTTEWVVRSSMKVLMASLALAGITGIYLRQARQARLLGLVGYLLFAIGYLVLLGVEFVAAFILPSLATTAPAYVQDVLDVATGGSAAGGVGLFTLANQVAGVGYLGGGFLFGIALFRTGILARWAAALLAVATASTVLLKVLPYSYHRFFAVPTGVALIWLGISLWRDQRHEARTAPMPVSVSTPSGRGVR